MRDRTVELLRIPAGELREDPRNWRRHPEGQKKAIRDVIGDVGFAGAVLARRDESGVLVLIDGHARAASVPPDTELPVLVLDVDEAEAGKILATFDPIGAMAEMDTVAFDALRETFADDEGALSSLLDSIAAAGAAPVDDEGAAPFFDASALLGAAKGQTDKTPQLLVPFRTVAELQDALRVLTAGKRSGSLPPGATLATLDGSAWLPMWADGLKGAVPPEAAE